jgi:thymidylate synthase (FAD)
MTDEYITDHPYTPNKDDRTREAYDYCLRPVGKAGNACGETASTHADPRGGPPHLIERYPHEYVPDPLGGNACQFSEGDPEDVDRRVCGYPEAEHHVRRPARVEALVRKADVAQYERPPMPAEARRGPVVTLIDAPVDPLGTMAVIGGIYTGKVRRSKSEVTDDDRRSILEDMQSTVLNGPLECIQFTFLVEGVSRSITHQAVRNRFAFFAQESLRFAVAEDWAQEVPLPPSLASLPQDHPAVGVWRRALNQSEDNYAALIGAGMPAEEARDVLPHAITTRLYWVVSLRTLLAEAGKRTCTQAQFPWRQIFAGVAKALRARGEDGALGIHDNEGAVAHDGWQYNAFADLMRPVCYQQGKCGFMAKFDRGCTIRNRVDANERLGRPSSEWHTEYDVVPPEEVVVGVGPKSVVVDRDGTTPVFVGAIDPAEWAADPAAARVVE